MKVLDALETICQSLGALKLSLLFLTWKIGLSYAVEVILYLSWLLVGCVSRSVVCISFRGLNFTRSDYLKRCHEQDSLSKRSPTQLFPFNAVCSNSLVAAKALFGTSILFASSHREGRHTVHYCLVVFYIQYRLSCSYATQYSY